MDKLSATGANPHIPDMSSRTLHKNFLKHVGGSSDKSSEEEQALFACQICGNVNYKNDEGFNDCIRCNWDKYNQWDGITIDEAINSPDWKGFGWKCPVCENYNAGEFPGYDICPVCEWQDDYLQRDEPDCWGGANYLCLDSYRLEYTLLKNEITRSETLKAQQLHIENDINIRNKYEGSDYRIIGDKDRLEHFGEHERYTKVLKDIKQKAGFMIKCPVCGEYDFETDNDFDVCEVCGWENDGVQLDDPDYRGGANKESLNEAKADWKKKKGL